MNRTRPIVKLAQLLGLAICFIGLSSTAIAQFGARLSGTVQDSSGAVIPGATVTLTSPATHQTKTATTTGDGAYTFNELAPGSYHVMASAANFKSVSIDNVSIAAETPRTTNITLATGGSNDTVTVDANATPSLQTSDASIGSTLTSETLQRLPTTGGDVYELLRTAPGITGDSARSGSGQAVFLPNGAGAGQSNSGIFQTENQIQISAAGQQVGANNYLIDGVSVNSLGQAGAAVVTPNQESVSQMTVLSTSYSAEDGRNTGAQIKVVSKSGTNMIHGSGYFRYDEPGFNAYNRTLQAGDALAAAPLRVSNKQRDYAASVGGPIVKDKLFLFASYEGYKSSSNTFVNQFVETPAFDAAVLAQRGSSVTGRILGSGGAAPRVVNILAPTCSYYQSANTTPSPFYGMKANGYPCAIVGNGIDVGSFGSASNNGTYFSTSNTNALYGANTPQYEYGAGLDGIADLEYAQLLIPAHAHASQYNGRMDWYATPRDQFAFSAYVTKLDNYGVSGAVNSRPQGDVPFKPLNEAGTFIFIHTFTPNLLNEFRANATRFSDNGVTDGAGTVNYGIPYIDVQNLPGGNDINYGTSAGSTSPAVFAENTYEVRDAVTISHGARTLKIGGEYRWEQDNNNLEGNARPTYSFQGLFNFANNAPVYEGITANPLTGGVPNTARYLRSNTLGLFVQHDWKISPTFTLNTGIRYEYFEPFRNKGLQVNLPVLGPAGSELSAASLTPHDHFFNSDFTGVSPKVGFAWVPTMGNGKVVIRGGVARAMNRLNFSTLDNAVEDGPGFFNFGLCCGSNTSPYAAGQIVYQTGSSNSPFSYAPNPALKTTIVNGLPVTTTGGVTTPIGIEVYGAPARVKTPYAYLYSLETQIQLPDTFTLTVGFQGSEAHHLPRLVNQNFLYTQPANQIFNAAYFLQTDSNSNYAAGNVHLAKTFHKGYQFDAIYTYAKSLDQISNGSGANSLANQTNPADNRTEWGPSDYDVRHRITVSGLWDIPGTKGDHHALNVVTNGWQINGIYTFHTGFPFTPVTTNLQSNPFVTNAATISPVRPYAYLGGYVSSCTNGNYINGSDMAKARFVTAVPAGQKYRPGIGRNSFSGPCFTDTDMSFAREQKFRILDHAMNLRFQANFFNLFNTLNLTPFTNGNAGGPAQIVGPDPVTSQADANARFASGFGRPASADAGRQVEFFARISF
jgi:hypothetical protein